MYRKLWLAIFLITLLWSSISPKDNFIWFLEAAPAIIGLVVMSFTYKTFKLTNLTYTLILIHSVILMVGAHYTYAEVPLFDWIRDYFSMERNNYDKLGHFAQGFIPAIIAREIFIRKKVINGDKWIFFLSVSVCLAFSATYELLEWLVAITTGESAEAFLGTQGYVWDTQSDMMFALVGATCALLSLKKVHDKQLQEFVR